MRSNDPQTNALRAMTPAQRLKAAERLYWSARALKQAAICARHPDWDDEAVRRALNEAFLYARG